MSQRAPQAMAFNEKLPVHVDEAPVDACAWTWGPSNMGDKIIYCRSPVFWTAR